MMHTPGSRTEISQHGELNEEDDSTDFKIAILSSLSPDVDHSVLLEALIACNGSIEDAMGSLAQQSSPKSALGKRKASGDVPARQTSLNFALDSDNPNEQERRSFNRPLARKGQTVFLYSPEDINQHTPCSIIHDFLPKADATALLEELLSEAASFGRQTFKVFDTVVQSPHSSSFYVSSKPEAEAQKQDYIYNGAYLDDVRELTPQMRKVSSTVQKAVNEEIAKRRKDFYPGGFKLKYQSPKQWKPNAAFVNCYDGGGESVGYHSDQLTYLGPRAVIGSLSLGVAREFRVRRVVARLEEKAVVTISNRTSPNKRGGGSSRNQDRDRADAEGQISIHLPHNSLLVSPVMLFSLQCCLCWLIHVKDHAC